jgi:chromosome segregation ATPase
MADHTPVQQAEEALAALVQEKAGLPDAIADARIVAIKSGKPGDFKRAEELENRHARMDFLISNARMTLAQRQIEYQVARIAELAEPRKAVRAELASIDDQIRALNEKRRKVANQLAGIDGQISGASHQRKQAENELAGAKKAHGKVFSAPLVGAMKG